MTKALEIVDRVRAMMAEGDLVPNPTTYHLCYDYLLAKDSWLVSRVSAAIERHGRLHSGAMEAILREQASNIEQKGSHLMQEAQAHVGRLLTLIERGGVATDRYGDQLRDGEAALTDDSRPTQALLRELAAATADMLRTTQDMQTQLVESGNTITELRISLERASRESRTDSLVDLPNRKAFDTYLADCVSTAHQSNGKVSVAMCDIDHFKRLNDSFGHSFGDDVLRLFATRLKECCADKAFAARYGGEEFVVVFPTGDAASAHQCLEGYRAFIERAVVKKRGTQEQVKFTFSTGIAEYVVGEEPQRLVERADQALYRAKHEGRNRICLA